MSGRPLKDLTGLKFGKLLVLETSGKSKSGHMMWLCRCDCNNECIILGINLKSGRTISCGCLKKAHINRGHREIVCKNCLSDKHYAKGYCRNCYNEILAEPFNNKIKDVEKLKNKKEPNHIQQNKDSNKQAKIKAKSEEMFDKLNFSLNINHVTNSKVCIVCKDESKVIMSRGMCSSCLYKEKNKKI